MSEEAEKRAFEAGARRFMTMDDIARPFQEQALPEAWVEYKTSPTSVVIGDVYVGMGAYSSKDVVLQLGISVKGATDVVRLSLTPAQVADVEQAIAKFRRGQDEENL